MALAYSPGRHFVMRSLHDLAEFEAVKSLLEDLPSDERDQLLSARKAHKEVVIFLHEWAHTLGLIHAQREARIMNSSYHHRQSEMSATEAEMVEASLRSTDLPSLRSALLAILERAQDPDWDPRDRNALRARMTGQPRSDAPAAAAQGSAAPNAGQGLAAVNELIAQQKEVEAEAALRELETALDARTSAKVWRAIAGTWMRLSAPTFAVAAATRSDRDTRESMKSWSIGARRRFAIPFEAEGLGLSAENEGRYARTFERGLGALAENDVAAAAPHASALEADFARLPAPVILRCGMAIAKRAYGPARALCEEAKRRQEDSVATWRFLSLLAAAQHKAKLAEEYRTRAIELDR
jgi:hypothetical protein